MDSFTYNIIYRPDSIEDICAYQQVMEYEVSNIFRKKINDEEESDNQINSQDNEMTGLELSYNKMYWNLFLSTLGENTLD